MGHFNAENILKSIQLLSEIRTSKVFRNGSHILWSKSWRYCFVKQPTYEIKAVIKSTSPGSIVPCKAKLKEFEALFTEFSEHK